jgi:hypothetical protein
MSVVKALKSYSFQVATLKKETEKEDACTSAARDGICIT